MDNSMTDNMRKTWDALAGRSAMHFIATSQNTWDTDDFLWSGEALVRDIFDLAGVDTQTLGSVALDLGCGIGRLSFAPHSMARSY
jgi:hypothetical protein